MVRDEMMYKNGKSVVQTVCAQGALGQQELVGQEAGKASWKQGCGQEWDSGVEEGYMWKIPSRGPGAGSFGKHSSI